MLAAPIAKLALGLALALLASLVGNGYFAYRWISSDAACSATRDGEIATAVEQGRRLAAEAYATSAGLVATMAVLDRDELLTSLDGIAERGRQVRVVYRERLQTIPAASCAPGADRMDAANAVIRGGP